MILGIWDGHDAGAAIVDGNKILAAINEERITRRKLEVGFPKYSILECMNCLKIKPENITDIAITTSDFSKTLTRYFPSLKENYYNFRRRKTKMPRFPELKRNLKYRLTQINSSRLTRSLTIRWFKGQLADLGFKNFNIHLVEHHQAHAASAFCSGMKKALVITVDGIGDGLSGSVNILDKNKIERISSISGRDSLGIFFEQVTNLLGMRELEDEGKVMALSNFAYPVEEKDNKMLDFFEVNGMDIKSRYSASKQYAILKNILWKNSREKFAYMAQYTLQKKMLELFKNSAGITGIRDIAWSGGVASNIKANMIIKDIAKNWFVFPHMGDGGLALGAAIQLNNELNGIGSYKLEDVYFGPEYDDKTIEKELKKHKLKYHLSKDISKEAGDLVSKGNIIFWFQGRMEYGPRALGNRSIIAPSGDESVKDKLNIVLKKRDWFQPFCPTVLAEDSKKFFKNIDKYDPFMTMGCDVRENIRQKIKAVIGVDNTARPQMLGKENSKFRKLIVQVKKNTGIGIVLNTSFNLHGYPLVMTPEDAITAFKNIKSKYLAIGNFLAEQQP